MPAVGKKVFGYDKKGVAMAKVEAKKTGKPMVKKVTKVVKNSRGK